MSEERIDPGSEVAGTVSGFVEDLGQMLTLGNQLSVHCGVFKWGHDDSTWDILLTRFLDSRETNGFWVLTVKDSKDETIFNQPWREFAAENRGLEIFIHDCQIYMESVSE